MVIRQLCILVLIRIINATVYERSLVSLEVCQHLKPTVMLDAVIADVLLLPHFGLRAGMSAVVLLRQFLEV